ncbi:MAG: hypothetical protein IT245_07540, partial [Bacteroidia bacterium]|nr:hypothetical protein [Bacteroidia bacterium]
MLSRLSEIRDVKQIKKLAQFCAEDKKGLSTVLKRLDQGVGREKAIASWILSHAVEINPKCLNDKQHALLIELVKSNTLGTIRRNIIRVWQFSFPQIEDLKIKIIDLSLQMLSDLSQDLAVRVFSITVLESYLEFMPEIREEVIFLIERESPNPSPSFSVRANKFIKSSNKL